MVMSSTTDWKGRKRLESLVEQSRSGHSIEFLYEDPSLIATDSLVIICHPNPLAQGSMHHKIPTLVARTAHQCGLPSLRFNFSGIGKTPGPYVSFEQQVGLLNCMISYAQEQGFTKIFLAGFSFGGACILQCSLFTAKLAIAPAWKFLENPPAESSFISIIHALDDDIAPVSRSQEAYPTLSATKTTLVLTNRGGHFFQNHTIELKAQCVAFFQTATGLSLNTQGP